MARNVAVSFFFSMMSMLSDPMTLNVAITKMNTSIRYTASFSDFIILYKVDCCSYWSWTL